jgi:two-component system, OmpR family, sensor kinase
MKEMKLSTKFLLVSGLILIIFCFASFAILFRAQKKQATEEMDHLLKNETLALSALVNTTGNGRFDFEMSPAFLLQYQQHNPNGFFRFVNPDNNAVLKESAGAPLVDCVVESANKSIEVANRNFRVGSQRFHPEIDGDKNGMEKIVSPLVCLVVGIDESPYQAMITKTLTSSVPVLIAMVVLLIIVMLILVRTLTRDLSILTNALATADFGVTHEFPKLPKANTPEVKAVVDKLAVLHLQATDVYREMWLFLGRASHQLKTPVTAMQSTLEVLLRKDRTKDELTSGLTDVMTAANQLGHLTKNLIASSRISYELPSRQREMIELCEFILGQVRTFYAQAEQLGVSIKVSSDSKIMVYGNRFLLTEIFGNLIENAILYSPHSENSEILISWESDSETVTVVISDRGPGLPNQVMKSLFEPFTRGDESLISGSGLGLFIAKRSAKLMLGDIWLLNTGPAGSKIAVLLPLSKNSRAH